MYILYKEYDPNFEVKTCKKMQTTKDKKLPTKFLMTFNDNDH